MADSHSTFSQYQARTINMYYGSLSCHGRWTNFTTIVVSSALGYHRVRYLAPFLICTQSCDAFIARHTVCCLFSARLISSYLFLHLIVDLGMPFWHIKLVDIYPERNSSFEPRTSLNSIEGQLQILSQFPENSRTHPRLCWPHYNNCPFSMLYGLQFCLSWPLLY